MPREQADPGRVRGVPAEREAVTAEQGAHREGDGQVEHDTKRAVMAQSWMQGPCATGDRLVADDLAGWRDDDVADGVPDAAIIGDGMGSPVTGSRCGWPENDPAERPVERVVALLLEGPESSTGKLPASTSGEGAAADVDDVGVDGVVVGPAAARAPRAGPAPRPPLRETIQRLRYHSAFPSSIATPCTMPSPRNQCGRPDPADGVCAHLEVAASRPGRDRPGHGQVLQRELGPHRFVNADHEGVPRSGQAQPIAGRHQGDGPLGDGAEDRSDSFRHRRQLRIAVGGRELPGL